MSGLDGVSLRLYRNDRKALAWVKVWADGAEGNWAAPLEPLFVFQRQRSDENKDKVKACKKPVF